MAQFEPRMDTNRHEWIEGAPLTPPMLFESHSCAFVSIRGFSQCGLLPSTRSARNGMSTAPPSDCFECGTALSAEDTSGLCTKRLIRMGLVSQLSKTSFSALASGIKSDVAVRAVLAVWLLSISIRCPARGLNDGIAGTWLVPR